MQGEELGNYAYGMWLVVIFNILLLFSYAQYTAACRGDKKGEENNIGIRLRRVKQDILRLFAGRTLVFHLKDNEIHL